MYLTSPYPKNLLLFLQLLSWYIFNSFILDIDPPFREHSDTSDTLARLLVNMQRQKRILTLDGGGVRGLSSLLILRKLLCLINVELTGDDIPVPAKDIFDLIAGTSTGGLIALMLVKLDMTIDECIAEYQILARHIFQHQSRYGRWTGGFGKSRYSGDNLVNKVQALIRNKGLEEDLMMADGIDGKGNQRKLKTVCSVICRELGGDWGRARADDPVFLCSDHCHAKNEYSHLVCTVCEAARATSAAPTYFPEFKLFDHVLVDGAYGNTNNPSHAVFGHFQDWMRLTSRHTQSVMMVNIGTGTMRKGGEVQDAVLRRPLWTYLLPKLLLDMYHVGRDLSTMATECEGVAKLMRQIESTNPVFQFWRFSESDKLFGVALDDWKAVEDGTIIEAAEKYLGRLDVLEELSRTARALALHSRAHRYAQRDKKVKVEIPAISSKSTSQQTSDEDSPEKVAVVVNFPKSNPGKGGGRSTQLELQLGDGIQLDDLTKPIAAEVDINGEAKQVEIRAADVQRRRRQSSGPGELFHNARAELRDAIAEGKKHKGDGHNGEA